MLLPLIIDSAPAVFELLTGIFGLLAYVPIVGPIFYLLSQIFGTI